MAKAGFWAGVLQGISSAFGGESAQPKPKRARAVRRPSSGAVSKPAAASTPRTLIDAMLAFIPEPPRTKGPGKPSLRSWQGYDPEAARFTERHPQAFLFGAIFDRMVSANAAWQSPHLLSLRLGHLDVRKLAAMKPEVLARSIKRSGDDKALHRFPATMAKAIVSASRKLLAEYEGDAARIWTPGTPAGVVVERLQEFDGISHKIANMTARLLVTYYGAHLTGWEDIDVAVDRHVARVFLRTELVPGEPRRTRYSAAELKPAIIAAARKANPSFPGALDEAAFVVGREWCHAGGAQCRVGARACPLVQLCPGRRKQWEIEG